MQEVPIYYPKTGGAAANDHDPAGPREERLAEPELSAYLRMHAGIIRARELYETWLAAWESLAGILRVRYGVQEGDAIDPDGTIHRKGVSPSS